MGILIFIGGLVIAGLIGLGATKVYDYIQKKAAIQESPTESGTERTGDQE